MSTPIKPAPGSLRTAFQRATLGGNIDFRALPTGAKPTVDDRLKIAVKTHTTALHVKAHHAKHEQLWVSRRYAELLQKQGAHPELRPNFAQDDPKARIKRQAQMEVAHKLATRLHRVEQAGKRMLGVDVTRDRDLGR